MEEYEIDVFIEISKNSHIKYEYDIEKKALICDRVLHTPFKYLFNYGFVPNTLSPDNDPIDVVVLMDDELVPGCYIKCRIIGCLETADDHGTDPKLIACPLNKIDPTYVAIQDIHDISLHTLKKIKYFFTHYKDLEKKQVTIGSFLDKKQSIQIFKESQEAFVANKKN